MLNLVQPDATRYQSRTLKRLLSLSMVTAAMLTAVSSSFATDFFVSSASQISSAMNSAQPGDVLIMTDGIWSDQQIDFAGDGTASAPITLRAETQGDVILNNGSTLSISGSHLVVDGLVFENGGENSLNFVIQFRGSDGDADNCRLTNTEVLNYNPPDSSERYHWVNLYGQDNRVDHCRLQGQDHSGVTVVVVLNDNGQAARHLIDHNAFLDRPVGSSNGFEGIRIGTSGRATTSAQCIVEHNLFDRMDGEIEIISNKAADNIYRYNTFRDSAGTLTLRHGKRARVEGNFFLGEGRDRSGGIRVVDSGHVIINNYIADIDDRADAAISLAAGIVNTPANGYQIVENIQIHNNTIVDVQGGAVIYDWGFGDTDNGGLQNQIASNVSFTNNLIRSSGSAHFEGQEGSNWTYDNNISFGASLGSVNSQAGLMRVNPLLSIDSTGLWRPNSGSPAIGQGASITISDDMDGQLRSGAIDIGADQVSSAAIIRTPLTRADVGPVDTIVVNTPPVFNPSTISLVGNVGVSTSYFNSATDPDGDNLTYSVDALPPGLTLDASTGEISGAVLPSASLTSTSVLTATDDGVPNLFDTLTIAWTINGTNQETPSIVINDSFTNGFSDMSGNGMELDFFTTSSNSGLDSDTSEPGPIDFASGSSGRAIHGLFAPQTLATVGDSLEATFDFTTPNTIGANDENFRFGLFSTAGAPNGQADYKMDIAASSGSPNPILNHLAGFYGDVDNVNAADTDLEFRTHDVNGSPTGRFMTTTGAWHLVSSGADGQITLNNNTSYTARLFVEASDPTLATLDITVEILNAAGTTLGSHTDSLFVNDQSDGEIGLNTLSFDMLGIYSSSSAFGSNNSVGDPDNGIDISNVTITFSTGTDPVLLGDVNMDGIVNFLDISPFIGILSAGPFKLEADCNEDGVVNFLDISPFIGILSGQ